MWCRRPVFASRVCLPLGAGACRQILPSADTPGGIFSGSISQNGGMVCPVASTGCILGIVFLLAGQEGLVEGCGEAGRELKRCSEDFCTGQMRRETNIAENRKTDVLGNDGSTPQAPAKEGGTSSMISGSRELQLLHSAPILQPDVFECSFSPSCPDTASAMPPCSGNAPRVCLGAVPGPLTSREGFSRELGRGQESSLSTAVLYPVVFLPGLLQFPALSYLQQGSQRSPILWLRACPTF